MITFVCLKWSFFSFFFIRPLVLPLVMAMPANGWMLGYLLVKVNYFASLHLTLVKRTIDGCMRFSQFSKSGQQTLSHNHTLTHSQSGKKRQTTKTASATMSLLQQQPAAHRGNYYSTHWLQQREKINTIARNKKIYVRKID